jgi:hypothetical protein
MSKFHEVLGNPSHGWFINLDLVTSVRWKYSKVSEGGKAGLRVTLFFGESASAVKLKGEAAVQFLKMLKEQR